MEIIKSPFSEALKAITGKRPPAFCSGIFNSSELSGTQIIALQDWCSCNANPHWATGLSMLESADLIVDGAVDNANIKTF